MIDIRKIMKEIVNKSKYYIIKKFNFVLIKRHYLFIECTYCKVCKNTIGIIAIDLPLRRANLDNILYRM